MTSKIFFRLIPDPQNPNKWIFDDGGIERPYERSCFYRDQLNSFENWIKIPQPRDGNVKNPPLYLPIALQSILEMEPRKTALMLFGKYMDICPSHIYNTLACNLNQKPASYLMRLLSGLSYQLVPHFWMVFIWTKLIGTDYISSTSGFHLRPEVVLTKPEVVRTINLIFGPLPVFTLDRKLYLPNRKLYVR